MAADVSSLVKSGGGNSSEILITRDLLGQFSKVGNNKDLDLKDFQHLQMSHDLKTEMVCLQRCNSPNSPSSSSSTTSSLDNRNHKYHKITEEKGSPPLRFLEESSLELKLVPSTTITTQCQSVCTLDKVKFALERAEKETIFKKRLYCSSSTYLVPSQEEEEIKNMSCSSSGMFAAGCPGCLMYVMILKTNPRCPRCNSTVPSPSPLNKKKRKQPVIDLNATL